MQCNHETRDFIGFFNNFVFFSMAYVAIKFSQLFTNDAGFDEMLIEQSDNSGMLGRLQIFNLQQCGYGIKTCVIQTVYRSNKMMPLFENSGFVQRLVRTY